MSIMTNDEENIQEGAVSEEGYHKDLSRRHVQMIAIGGAIGTGLFLGAGQRLQIAGPSLALIYALCGICAFMVLRATGELVMYRPSSGGFVTYAREFLGEWAAYAVGWFFFLNWAMSGIVDITAVALYMQYWSVFGDIPQWAIALGALVLVGGVNLAGVKYFGEIEFWFSLVKVFTLVVFLIVAVGVLGYHYPLGKFTPGLHLIAQNGGFFPHGIIAPLLLTQGVVFAYSGVEMIAVAAGECKDARHIVPKAVNSVLWRIVLFYVGSVILLVCLLPWSVYKAAESPFVTFFDKLGVPGAAGIMNFVVLTAALSSFNSGLYSTGRILRALAVGGSGPKIMAKLNKNSVPYVGILSTMAIYLVGVVLNYYMPSEIFEIVLSGSSLGILGTWACILFCQLRLHAAIKRGDVAPTNFSMPGAPYTGWLTLLFLGAVLIMMAFDYPSGTYSVAAIPVLAIIFFMGWHFLHPESSRQVAKNEDEAS